MDPPKRAMLQRRSVQHNPVRWKCWRLLGTLPFAVRQLAPFISSSHSIVRVRTQSVVDRRSQARHIASIGRPIGMERPPIEWGFAKFSAKSLAHCHCSWAKLPADRRGKGTTHYVPVWSGHRAGGHGWLCRRVVAIEHEPRRNGLVARSPSAGSYFGHIRRRAVHAQRIKWAPFNWRRNKLRGKFVADWFG